MPTPERREHGLIERLRRPIADESGGSSRPYRAVDTLAVMERRGSITASMRQAGEDFRARFATAQLDPLAGPRLLAATGRRRLATKQGRRAGHAGRRRTRGRLARVLAVGGLGSPGGSCLWHVVGWERSLKEWALEQGWSGRRVSQEAASGILIAALGALEAHYRPERHCENMILRLTNPDRSDIHCHTGEIGRRSAAEAGRSVRRFYPQAGLPRL